ncbi:MAG: Vitamin B12 import ATP-binding protein BtuD [Chroococcopsis gigantea SAG 12.99]|jgi:subfamily B ATP-binding cassette protein HlyB/CyaB|nr:peptidase domain-containing ABC transporter [Chlorogloea purpurea SAG 13.99]MDV3001202.1 Vitamin B12 import ATP-binding protein BtuD [Chroococcopsis gigantea SAG 12.99]
MTYTPVNFQTFLETIEPFNQLPSGMIRELSDKLQPWRYGIGDVIIMRGKLSSHLVILYEGEARLLAYDPRTQMPTTLRKLGSGDLFGWVDLVRGAPTETLTASTDNVVCLTLKQQDFIDICRDYPQFRQYFQVTCSDAEVFNLLGAYLNQQAQGEGNLKELVKDILPSATVYYLPQGRSNLEQHPPLKNHDYVWFASDNNIEDLPLGNRLNGQQSFNIKEKSGGRLVGFPESLLQIQQPQKETANHLETIVIDNGAIALNDLPEETAAADGLPYAHKYTLTEATQSETKGKKTNYPVVKGRNTLEVGLACFQMLAMVFNIPFRRDQVSRILNDQLQRSDTFSLPFCGAITEMMGLTSQLVGLKASSLPHINTPALILWQDSIAVLYEISPQKVVVGVPEVGLVRKKTSDFLQSWGDEGEVLLVQPTKETQQQRFSLSWFWPSVKKHRRVLIEVFIASFFVQLFALANPMMIQVIIDKVIVQNSPDTLHVLGVFLLFIALFEGILTFLRTSLFVDTTNRIDMTLGSEIIDHLLRLPLKYFERRPVGEISTRVNELENIRQFLTGTALTVVLDAIFSVIYVVVMLIYSPILTIAALGIIPILVFLTVIFSPIIRTQLRTKAERNAETQSFLVEVMSGIQTVKAQNIELRSRWQWQERYSRYVSAGFQTVMTSTMAGSLSHFFNQLSGLLVLWVGAYLVLKGDLTLGQLIAFRIISGYVTSPILRLTQLWQNFQETGLSLERLADIVDTPQEGEQDRQNIPMPAIKGEIKYEAVSFRFNPHGALQLYNVSLEFPPGTFVAVVGQSGAGKSTLTKLLARLYEPEAGRILVDGYDINKVELYSLRRQIGVVPQETLLFDGTVEENISLTKPEATTEEIINAARIADAHDFIMSLPNGYNTRVGERGASLSGGQRQRIALARSVIQKPRILVLDEATSALDYATEQKVCINLGETFKDHTVFFITHRLASIKTADVIVMMDSGTVAEMGPHEELMAKKGLYYHLYNQQDSRL